MVPVGTGTSNLGVPLAMDFLMAYGPPASHDESYIHSWMQTWRGWLDYSCKQCTIVNGIMRREIGKAVNRRNVER
jgi:hypothetical protein